MARVVLITGASSGIGAAAVRAFEKEGATVVAAARRGPLKWDVAETSRAPELIEMIVREHGRLDVLVNNAGVMATARFHEQDFSELETVMRVNYLGAAALTRAAVPAMLKQGAGHVVNVASMAGMMGFPYMAAYCASKWALVGLTEALRREYYGTGVTFTALCPGSVDTPMAAKSLADEKLGRLARPKTAEQVAARILDAADSKPGEILFGDAPGFLLKIAKFAPELTDWLVHHTYKKAHPLGRN